MWASSCCYVNVNRSDEPTWIVTQWGQGRFGRMVWALLFTMVLGKISILESSSWCSFYSKRLYELLHYLVDLWLDPDRGYCWAWTWGLEDWRMTSCLHNCVKYFVNHFAVTNNFSQNWIEQFWPWFHSHVAHPLTNGQSSKFGNWKQIESRALDLFCGTPDFQILRGSLIPPRSLFPFFNPPNALAS
jgi:hypothetical protein